MIEKDNIQDLFSKAFENHASAVKPELWAGVQAKMAAAGAVGGTAAVKGISALTKWIIGTAAVTTVGVTTALVLNNTKESEAPKTENTIPATTNQVAVENEKKTETPKVTSYNGKTLKDENAAEFSNGETPLGNDGGHVTYSPANIGYNPDTYVVNYSNASGNNSEGSSSSSSTSENHSASSTNSGTKPSTSAPEVKPSTNYREANETKPELKEAKAEVPNIFTPNFDRNNDYFELISSENLESLEISIYDQNGKKVYTSNEMNFKWDGTDFSNSPCAEGIFSYQLSVVGTDGKAKTKKDFVYLKR